MQVVVYPNNTVCVDGRFPSPANCVLFIKRLKQIKSVKKVLIGKIDRRVTKGNNSYMIFRNREVKNRYSL